METPREDAQSFNDELNTVNSELQRKVEELDRANDNLRNLFEGTEIATVFLDRNLVIRSFTPAISSIYNLKEIDRGRALSDLVSEIVDLDLRAEIEPVLATGVNRERRVVRRDGKGHYLMRVLPYRTADRGIDGVLITFTDITQITRIEEYQEELAQQVETMLRIVQDTTARSLPGGPVRDTLLARLRVIGEYYVLVSRARLGDVLIPDIAAKELGSFGIGRDGRVAVEGPALALKAKAAVAIGLALHELTANACDHGALSVPEGRVRLAWAIEQPRTQQARLAIRGRESNGPPVQPPAAKGYGSHLIENELQQAIGATAILSFAPGGLSCDIALPLSADLVVAAEGGAKG